jgi:DNA-binding transcriptional regulator YiaG
MPIPEVNRLIEIRRELGLSRSLCARILGIPETTLARWELGVHRPSPIYRKKLWNFDETIEKILEKHKKGGNP